MLQSMLYAAQIAVTVGDYCEAIGYLYTARSIARKAKNVRAAVHCVIAIEALLPLAVEYKMYQFEQSNIGSSGL